MKSNLKFAIDICDVQQKMSKSIFHMGRICMPWHKRAWGSSYLYYLLSGPHTLENIANDWKAKSFERGFLIIHHLINFIQPQ